jgi:NADH-quinone oxidoreductase subunit G
MAKTVNLTIDDKTLTVPAGTLVVDAAKMIGNDIPVFCYHPKMEPVGMCRMCLVDIGRPVIDRATGQPQLNEDGTPKIQFGPKLDTACTTPVSEGMVIRTGTQKVTDARRDILEFLLTSHPLDCPICDKGGECPLQNLTMAHGPGNSRFLLDDKIHLAKHFPLGEMIFLDRERCIQCARCVRFQSDVAGDPVIGFSQRGRSLEIVTYSEPGFDSYFSGNTTDICPVGALTTADFRFGARPWELRPVASICTQCPVGCNLTLNVRREAVASGRPVVKRVMPRQNEEVNEIWICDKGRWAYQYAEDDARLVDPLVRKNGALVKASWDEALDLVAKRLGDSSGNLLTLAGGRLSNEDLFALRKLTEALGGKPVLHSYMAGGDWTARIGLAPGSNIGKMGAETAILVVASDLEEEAPVWYLRLRAAARRGAKLIVANARPTKLDKLAAHVVRYAYGDEAATVRALQAGEAAPEALKAAAQVFAGAENAVVFFGSDGLGLEGSQILVDACAELLLKTNHTGRANNGLVGVWPKANQQGAWDMGFAPVNDLASALQSAGVVYIAADDPAGVDPALAKAIDGAGFVVVQELFLSETAKLADVVLPVQSFIEREGSFTSGERRVQRFYQAVAAMNGPRADFRIVGELAKRLSKDVEGRAASLVMAQIAREISGYSEITYPKLAEVHEQWPIVHREDLFYGGTSYQNRQGLGIALQPAVTSGAWKYDAAAPVSTAKPSANGHGRQPGDLLVVPVTRLYDRGTTVLPSQLLHARMAHAEARVHPNTASRLQLSNNDPAALSLENGTVNVQVKVDETLPEGVALVARSTGIPVSGAVTGKLQRLAQEATAGAR